MNQITNDTIFKQALQQLDPTQQRTVAARFLDHIAALSDDVRIHHVIKTAAQNDASEHDLSASLKSARAAMLDSHTRCGSEGNWTAQAGYFVARAAVAAITPPAQSKAGGPAWQAAMSSRMACTSSLIDDESDEIQSHSEREWQHQALTDYLNAYIT